MDAMALLCTLHADGPTTLRLLRGSGIKSLAELQSVDAHAISEVLEIPAAAARRFMREAAALSSRIGEEPLQSKGAPPVMSAPPTPEPVEVSELSMRDQRLVSKVLTRWREADEANSEPEVESTATPSGLQVGDLDGLTGTICDALNAAGVDSLEALMRADPLALRDATGFSFSTLRRLQFLARRAAVEPTIEERISVSERPSLEGCVRAWELSPEPSDAGGPFA